MTGSGIGFARAIAAIAGATRPVRGGPAALVALATLLALATPAFALDVTLQVSRPEVSVGEQFTLSAQVSHGGMGKLSAPTFPELEGLRQVSSYMSQNFSYVNGRATSSLTVQYVMVADQEGEFQIGPAKVQKGDEEAVSNVVTITVSPAGSSASAQRFGEGPVSAQSEDLIVLGKVDNTTPFVNEQVTFTFTFLHRVRILEGGRYTAPSFQGFWTEEIDKTDPRQVVIDGKRYTAERIQTALFPTGAGEYIVGEAFVNTVVEDRRRRANSRSPFDVFGSDRFGLFRSGREVVLKTDAIPLNVRALPTEGKPNDFTGAVGDFTLTAKADRAALDAGEPVTLTVRLAGAGNLKVVPDPDLGELDGFKVYESSSEQTNRKQGDRILGEKVWEFVLVPTSGGDVEIPTVHMSVFDPNAEQYVRLATDPIPLAVTATALDEALALGGDIQLAKERVRLRQRDIRWVKPVDGSLRREGASPFTSPGFLFAHFVPLLAFAGSNVYRRQRDRLRNDVGYARSRGAARVAQKRLKEAADALGSDRLEDFFGALSVGLRGYVADKLSLSAANLDEATARVGLAERNVNDGELDDLFGILESCDTARFSPLASDAVGARVLLDRASAWITAVEKR